MISYSSCLFGHKCFGDKYEVRSLNEYRHSDGICCFCCTLQFAPRARHFTCGLRAKAVKEFRSLKRAGCLKESHFYGAVAIISKPWQSRKRERGHQDISSSEKFSDGVCGLSESSSLRENEASLKISPNIKFHALGGVSKLWPCFIVRWLRRVRSRSMNILLSNLFVLP